MKIGCRIWAIKIHGRRLGARVNDVLIPLGLIWTCAYEIATGKPVRTWLEKYSSFLARCKVVK